MITIVTHNVNMVITHTHHFTHIPDAVRSGTLSFTPIQFNLNCCRHDRAEICFSVTDPAPLPASVKMKKVSIRYIISKKRKLHLVIKTDLRI